MYVCMGCVQQSEAASLHTGGAPALHAVGLLRDRVAAGCGQGRRAQPRGVVIVAAALCAVLAASYSALQCLPLVLPRQGKLESHCIPSESSAAHTVGGCVLRWAATARTFSTC